MSDRGESDKRSFPTGIRERLFSGKVACRRQLLLAVFVFMLMSLASAVGPLTSGGSEGGEQTANTLATGTPPVFRLFLPRYTNTTEGQITYFTVWVQDVDGDVITVTWDFNDGTTPLINTTTPGITTTQTVKVSHVYDLYTPGQGYGFPFPGAFNVTLPVNVTLDDGNGNIVYQEDFRSCVAVVSIQLPNDSPFAANITGPGPADIVEPETETVTLSATSSDPEGDELWWTFVFNYSDADYLTMTDHTPRTSPSENVWSNQSFTLPFEGFYNITVYVCDAPEPYQIFPHNLSASFGPIHAMYNRLPNFPDAIQANPPTPIINSSIGYIEVTYSVTASDVDNDTLYVTWNFGDGTDNVTNVSAGDTTYTNEFNQTRNYTNAGTFNITALITDGRPGHDRLFNLTITVESTNLPPNLVIYYTYPTYTFALPNETVNFTFVFSDYEFDPIEVVLDWGDGSPLEFYNLTAYEGKNITIARNHSYAMIGKYNVTVQYTDHKTGLFDHNLLDRGVVTVGVPTVFPKVTWSWWDYTSLALFLMIPLVFFARFYQVARQRKKLELEGLTLEEWKIMKSEIGKDALLKRGPEGD